MRFIHKLRLNFVSFFNQNIKESKYIKKRRKNRQRENIVIMCIRFQSLRKAKEGWRASPSLQALAHVMNEDPLLCGV